MKNRHFLRTTAALTIALALLFCAALAQEATDYADSSRWAWYEAEEDESVDVFFIAPTNVGGGEGEFYVQSLDDAEAMAAILGAINMQKGIYDGQARFFAPYYRQLTIAAYRLEEEQRLAYSQGAWQDVQDAFAYYMANENDGRAFLLAGFSQGAELGLRLMKEYADDEAFFEQLVAAYLIGWRVTEQDLAQYPALKMAQGGGRYGRNCLL